MRLKNRSVVVTGASSGMGKAIVELFVKEGANVIAVARQRSGFDAPGCFSERRSRPHHRHER